MSYKERVIFFCVGDSSKVFKRFGANPWNLLRDYAYQSIMLAIADEPLSISEIASKVSLNEAEVSKRLSNLMSCGLVRKINDQFATTIPVISDFKAGILKSLLRSTINHIKSRVIRELPIVRDSFHKTPISKHFSWNDLAHIIVGAFLMDFAFLSCVESLMVREGLFFEWSPEQIIIPFFGLEIGPNQENFGVNSQVLDGCGISIIHATFVNRPLEIFHEIIREDLKQAIVSICSGEFVGEVPKRLLELELIRRKNGYVLNIPLLKNKDKDILTEAVLEASHRVAEAAISKYNIIRKAFRDLSYNMWISGIGDFVEMVLHFIMALVIKELSSEGHLPRIPERPKMNWGIWLWEKPWTLSLSRIYAHLLLEIEEIMDKWGTSKDAKSLLARSKDLFSIGKQGEALRMLKEILDAYKMIQATRGFLTNNINRSF